MYCSMKGRHLIVCCRLSFLHDGRATQVVIKQFALRARQCFVEWQSWTWPCYAQSRNTAGTLYLAIWPSAAVVSAACAASNCTRLLNPFILHCRRLGGQRARCGHARRQCSGHRMLAQRRKR